MPVVKKIVQISLLLSAFYLGSYGVLSSCGSRFYASSKSDTKLHYNEDAHANEWRPFGFDQLPSLYTFYYLLFPIDNALIHSQECDCSI